MIKAAKIGELLMDKKFTTTDMYKAMMALKLSRLAYSPKIDSMVDLIGYTEGWWNYINDHRFKVKTEEEQWEEFSSPTMNFSKVENEILEKLKQEVSEAADKEKKKKELEFLENMAKQKDLENMAKVLSANGYRIFPPESIDWKDQN